jgi:HAMP domain-containing protein
MGWLRIGIVVAAIVVAAIAANVTLLSLAGTHERVGRLSPTVAVGASVPAGAARSRPPQPVRTERPERGADD